MQILAYNRTVRDLNGRSKEQFLDAIRGTFTVTENASPEPEKRGRWSMYLDGKWYGLNSRLKQRCRSVRLRSWT